MSDCTTTFPRLPAIGTEVRLTDGGVEGIVRGYGYGTPEGQLVFGHTTQTDVIPSPEMAPFVLVQVGGFWLPGYEQECWINMIPVHPDNLEVI